MKKLTVYFFAIIALLLLFKAGCSDISRTGIQDQVEGIKSVVPAQGPYGARVLIGGKGFTDDPEVLFNGVAAEIESANDSTILTRVPLEASSGPVEVIAGQEILSGPTFSIDSTRTLFLNIDDIRPETGRYRDTMYIAGSGFDPIPDENEVYLNEFRSPVLEASDSLLITTVPVGASSGLFTVIAGQDTAIGPRFELLRHQITDIDPTSGRVGTQVKITGSDFSDQISENSVFFNGVQAEILESSTSQLLTSVPFEATSGPVSIAVRRDTVEGPTFSVQELQILEVAPLSGEVGTGVMISGNGFSPNIEENTIQFNGVNASVLSASETELQTQVPEGATNGIITVSVNGMTVTGPEFIVEAGAPVIASVEPLSGLIGEQVTINGSNFSADTSEVTVLFNETEAEVIGSTETVIQTVVPEGAVSGPITVIVNGKSTTGPEFEIITTGTLIVEISTSGSDIDSDGYLLTIGAGDGVRTDVNDTITRSGLNEGTYEVLLGDIETNCYLNQELPNPRTATVEAGATTTVEYIITCEGLNEPPVAAFTVSCNNLTCDLDASGSSDADGSIIAYDWILGDGSIATGQLISHSYETSGTYTVELTVTDNEGAMNLASQDVSVTVPEITNVSPLSGVPGSTVIISGANFSSVASENNVQFNGIRAELNSASETELSAIVPGDATTGPITVSVNGYIVEGPVFTVEAIQQPKTLEVVVSTQGSMQDENGYTLSVTGQDDRIIKPNDNVMYSGILENSVQVGLTGVAANCAVEGENPRTVNLDNPDNAGFTEFVVTCSAPAPEITGISPTSGTTGSEVVITGSNFSPTASENIVEFNGVRAELNSVSETELLAIVPGTATSGPVTVTVNGQTAMGPEFTVTEVGSLEVSTTTSGSDLDADGYTLSVESLSDQSIGINETKLLDALPTGSYLVELTGIAANCQLSEELPNPRTLEVTANVTTSTNYNVYCLAPAPTIQSIAPDSGTTGTQVTITGSNFSPTASDNIVTFNGLRAELNSATTTELVAFVPFEATTGPVEVTVNGQTATGPTFTVITTGRLEVNISTTGTSLDSNGYGLILDGGTASQVGINDFVAYDDLSEGSHSVELTDIASNCFITQDRSNPYNVGIVAGDTTATNINVQCNEPAPAINSINPTSGPTGSEVVINGANFSSVASENNVQFNGVRAELNTATETELRAIVPGSATTGPVTVTVNGQTATGPTFSVITTGSIQVNISTVGSVPDPDGYEIILDQEKPQLVDINDSYIFSSVETGEHTIELANIAENCSITNGTSNPTGVTVYFNEPTQVTYDLLCDEVSGSEKILFRDDEVYMMDPDGANVAPLTKSGAFLPVKSPVLSNDGSRIVYMEQGDIPNIVIMNSDGSNAKRFQIETFSSPRYPAWSPDDKQIVFVGTSNGSSEIFVINSDGSNLTQITKTENINENNVHWSPGNNDILVSYREQTGTSTYAYGLILMNVDGSNQREITQKSGYYSYGRISPNGKEVIYTGRPGDCFQIFRMNIDGSNIRALTSETELNCEVINGLDWSPDGSQIVLQSRPSSIADSEISIMPSDGSASPIIISNTPSHPASLNEPTWGIYRK